MQLTNTKAVIFDYDDTLVKTRESKWEAIKETARRHYNLELADTHIAKFWGLPFEEMLTNVLNQSDTFVNLQKNYFSITNEFPMEAHKGALELVKRLQDKDYLVSVLTASNKMLVINDLTSLKFPIDIFFDIQTAEDTKYHKPDPRVFIPLKKKLKRKNIDKSEILYIGDSTRDYFAARDAKINFLGIAHKKSDSETFKREGANWISSFNELAR
jgi:phosphoglycolate phosphatase-like HAD superfamily hydrolase